MAEQKEELKQGLRIRQEGNAGNKTLRQ